ncbi:MAG: YlxR family protein [Chloroflexia bacterium]|nr:YlxR family protein [Chloroflexia bacterium]
MAKTRERIRHVPLRTCVGCRQKQPKRDMIRILRTPEGELKIDSSGRGSGRGAYLCPTPRCWELALKRRALNRALRLVLTPAEVAHLREYAQSLPAAGTAGKEAELAELDAVDKPALPA